jgi:hypothetical protein
MEMPYTVRELPSEEWFKLIDYPICTNGMPPEDVTIFVVERDGEIVGHWSAGPIIVLEGLWVAEEHQKTTALGKLYAAMITHLANIGLPSVYSIVQTKEMLDLARHGGFEEIDGRLVNKVLN